MLVIWDGTSIIICMHCKCTFCSDYRFLAILQFSLHPPPPPLIHRQQNPAVILHTPYRQLHWSYLCSFNSWLLLNPSDLMPEYAMTTIPLIQSLTDTRNLATIITFVAISFLAIYGLTGRGQQHRVSLFGLSLIVFPYLPASNLFFPVGFVIAERVLYLPSMGFCMLVGYGAWKLLEQNPSVLKLITLTGITALLLTHATKTLSRNREWLDEFSLYTSAIRTNPKNAKMAHNLGARYGKVEEERSRETAAALMQLSMAAEPLYISPVSDYGYLLQLKGRTREAEMVSSYM